jgi:hypothetical protein
MARCGDPARRPPQPRAGAGRRRAGAAGAQGWISRRAGSRERSGTRASPPMATPPGDDTLERQRRATERMCERLGLELVEVVREREPNAGNALERAGVNYLIERLAAGDASCLVVSGLDRLSRSVSELGTLVQWLERSNVRLVAVELDLEPPATSVGAAPRPSPTFPLWSPARRSPRDRLRPRPPPWSRRRARWRSRAGRRGPVVERHRDAGRSLLRSPAKAGQNEQLAARMRAVERAYGRLARAARRGPRAWRLASAEVLDRERDLELLLRTRSWI